MLPQDDRPAKVRASADVTMALIMRISRRDVNDTLYLTFQRLAVQLWKHLL
jgi:hypothetical protein